jgi:hypothetical protein
VTPVALSGTSPGIPAESPEYGPVVSLLLPTSSISAANLPTSTTTASPSTPPTPDVASQPSIAAVVGAEPVVVVEFLASWTSSHLPLAGLLFLLIAVAAYFLARYWHWIVALVFDQLYVGNLDRSIDEKALRKLFKDVAATRSVKLPQGRSHHALRHGFVKMETATGSHKAIGKLNKKEIAGHKLIVKKARTYLFERYPNA